MVTAHRWIMRYGSILCVSRRISFPMHQCRLNYKSRIDYKEIWRTNCAEVSWNRKITRPPLSLQLFFNMTENCSASCWLILITVVKNIRQLMGVNKMKEKLRQSSYPMRNELISKFWKLDLNWFLKELIDLPFTQLLISFPSSLMIGKGKRGGKNGRKILKGWVILIASNVTFESELWSERVNWTLSLHTIDVKDSLTGRYSLGY